MQAACMAPAAIIVERSPGSPSTAAQYEPSTPLAQLPTYTLHVGMRLGGHATARAAQICCESGGGCSLIVTDNGEDATPLMLQNGRLPKVSEEHLGTEDSSALGYAGWQELRTFPLLWRKNASVASEHPKPPSCFSQLPCLLREERREEKPIVIAMPPTAPAIPPTQLIDLMNNEGLTPLTLAAKLGKRDLFEDLWKMQREPRWKWGGVDCALLPLDQVDDIGQVLDENGMQDEAAARRSNDCGARCSARGGARCGFVGCCRDWIVACCFWWLPLPTLNSLDPVPPTALSITVKYSVNAMLDSALPGGLSAADAAAARNASANHLVLISARPLQKQQDCGQVNQQHVAREFTEYHKDAQHLLDLALAPTAVETEPLLQQLASRKWDRMYQLRFLQLALTRIACACVAWGLLVARYAETTGSHLAVGIAWALLIGAGLVFCVHALRALRYSVQYRMYSWLFVEKTRWEEAEEAESLRKAGGKERLLRPFFSRLWPLLQPFATLAGLCASCVSLFLSAAFGKFGMLRPVFLWHHFCGCGRKRPIIGQMTADGCAPREVQLYAAAHDGVFGHLYLMTLFTASGLLSAGGAVDLWGGGGWAAATPLYAFGGLFSILHCLYFLLGIESRGLPRCDAVHAHLGRVLQVAGPFCARAARLCPFFSSDER